MSKRRGNVFITGILMGGDILLINFSFLFAYWFRFSSGLIPVFYGVPPLEEYIQALGIVTIILLLALRTYGGYNLKKRLSFSEEFLAVLKAMTVGMLILMASTFLYREFSYSRGVLLMGWLAAIISIAFFRLIMANFELWLRQVRGENLRTLIIGTEENAGRIIQNIYHNPRWGYEPVGLISTNEKPLSNKYIMGNPILGSLKDFPKILSEKKIDEVILSQPELSREKIAEIILDCEKEMVGFRWVADFLGVITSQVKLENFAGVTLLGLAGTPLDEAWNRFLKRTMDVVLSVIGLILLSPLFLLVAIIIKGGSPGPVFYKQERVGQDGKHFWIYKFRTMTVDAEAQTGPVRAQVDDERRTRIGKILRRLNIDELPQLFNVLKGDMSLVGPRPERPYFVGQFKEDIPRYMARHKIKSGVTGWAQINGLRGNTSIEERTKYDLFYTENWSLFFDIKILLRSILAIKNAY